MMGRRCSVSAFQAYNVSFGGLSTLLLVVVALAAGCGGHPTHPATVPSPPVNPTASVSPASSPVAELRCRLPVSTGAMPGTAGFITFPGGTFSPDPASNPTLPGHSDTSYVNGYTYDFSRSRWLPTSWRAVAGDGSAYAYWDGTAIHIFDIDSGRDGSLGAPPAWDHLMQPPSIFALAPEGVYASSGSQGMWLIGPAGVQRQVTKEGYWDAVASGAGWGRPTNSYPDAGAVYSIVRLDLKTGVSEPWFTRAGVLEVVGVDLHGSPIVMVMHKTGPDSSDLELWLVTGRDQGTRIYSAPSIVNGLLVLGLVTPLIGDSHGVWFEASGKIYLYNEQSGVHEMASARAGLAGGCG
jgi:hypothetical protein